MALSPLAQPSSRFLTALDFLISLLLTGCFSDISIFSPFLSFTLKPSEPGISVVVPPPTFPPIPEPEPPVELC